VGKGSSSWWESLESDTLPWLLDTDHPNLLWRALVELVGRPLDSPAVGRARGGADAAEPVATLLSPLRPDGTWELEASPWQRWDGSAWRIIAVAQWGADPTDPRLCAAIERMLDTDDLALSAVSPCALARWLQAAAELGWGGDPRFEEGVARLETRTDSFDPGHWKCVGHDQNDACVVAAVAATGMLAAAPGLRRRPLAEWAVAGLLRALQKDGQTPPSQRLRAGHPNLLRTDPLEALWVMGRAGVPFDAAMAPALGLVQASQDESARWQREVTSPDPAGGGRSAGVVSQWVTLRALVALRHYAEAAALPRRFPERPQRS
jgi:hypothetical protein